MMKLINKYGLSVIIGLLCLTPLLWFVGRPDVIINGLDTNFPLDPLVWFQRRLFLWNDSVNAGGDFSSSVSGLFFHLVQVIPYVLGFSLRNAQILSLVFWFSAVVLASYYFASSLFGKSKMASLIFVVLYNYNTYILNTWENAKVSNIALLIGIPLCLAFIHRYANGKLNLKQVFLFSIPAAILTSGSGINPAYFLTILISIVIYTSLSLFFYSGEQRKKVLVSALVCLVSFFLVNLYWMLPLINFLFFTGQIGSLTDIGLTDWLDSLSANTSFLNVLRLQGAWDWYVVDQFGVPLYIPYADKYFNHPIFILFSFSFFIFSLLSFLFAIKKKRFLYVFFGILIILATFLSSGTHAPSGAIYTFLTQKLPFFSFFRSPWYIFTPLLLVGFSGLCGLLYVSISQKSRFKILIFLIASLYVAGNLIYTYPLLTGKVFRPNRSDSFYISFPDYVYEAKEYLESNIKIQRVFTYPEDQLESFDWGYRGTDSILGLFSKKQVLTPSFNAMNAGLKLIMTQIYSNIKRHEYEAVANQLQHLRSNTLLNKKDQSSLSEKVDDQSIASFFNKTTFGQWDLWELKESDTPHIFIPQTWYKNLTGDETFAALSAVISPNSVVVNANDSQIQDIDYSEEASILAQATNLSFEDDRLSNSQQYKITIPKKGSYALFIENSGLGNNAITVTIDSQTEIVSSTKKGGLIRVGPANLEVGEHTIEIEYPVSQNLLETESFEKFSKENSLRSDEMPTDMTKTLVAFNDKDERKDIIIPVNNFDPYSKYILSFDSKYFYGSTPIVQLVQSVPNAQIKIQPEALSPSGDWATLNMEYEPIEVQSKLGVFITMPANTKKIRSKTFLENFSFKKVYDNKVFFLEDTVAKDDLASISFTKVNPTKYKGQIENGANGFFIVMRESYSPHWKLTSSGSQGEILHFSANGYANGWYVPAGDDNQKIEITYTPQRFYLLGVLIALGGLGLLAYVIIYKNKFSDI